MKTSEVLIEALELLGPNGERWTKFQAEDRGRYCIIGAIGKVEGGETFCGYGADRVGTEALFKALTPVWTEEYHEWTIERPTQLWRYNDHPNTEFKHVRALFHKAIRQERAKEAQAEREAGVY